MYLFDKSIIRLQCFDAAAAVVNVTLDCNVMFIIELDGEMFHCRCCSFVALNAVYSAFCALLENSLNTNEYGYTYH